MSDGRQDPALRDAMDSIRSIGEDWESRDHQPPDATDTRSDATSGESTGADNAAGADTKEDHHG